MNDELFKRLSSPSMTGRTEADIQSDIKILLTSGHFNLEAPRLEEQIADGSRRRIDIATGATVIEVKKKLTNQEADAEYINQLAGYVRTRMQQDGSRYNGILTDGLNWWLFEVSPAENQFVLHSRFELSSPSKGLHLIEWLQAVLATRKNVKPTKKSIENLLGASSPAYEQDSAYLLALYKEVRSNPMVGLKRELWARLLRSALGAGFDDEDKLFIDHTLLVLEASAIGHAVMGLSLEDLLHTPDRLLNGEEFREVAIYNVIESGFFDWILLADEGPQFLHRLVRRIGMFNWKDIDHDALKILYESVINAEVRKGSGEYYTPDWLAEGVTRQVLTEPLAQSALDPACGSGTFLFQAIRLITTAAEAEGWDSARIVEHVQNHVFGLDIHPVSVLLARVTYLLALGKHLENRDELWVPVHLGDSMQWYQPGDYEENIIRIGTDGIDLATVEHEALFTLARTLAFPLDSMGDTDTFDQLVSALTERAKEHVDQSAARPNVEPILKRFGFSKQHKDFEMLQETFNILCDLNAEGRDSIWGFYVRNQVRPLWLSMKGRRVDVLIGNPPWVAYRYMTSDLQIKYKAFAKKYRIWEGGNLTPQQDLVALFIARSVAKYLNDGGQFGFVTPYSVLNRRSYAGFRSGVWGESLRSEFTLLWDLQHLSPKGFFPVPSAVVFGIRRTKNGPMCEEPAHGFPTNKIVYRGKYDKQSWSSTIARVELSTEENVAIGKEQNQRSEYNDIVVNGATLFPKVLTFVREKKQAATKLGRRSGTVAFETLPSIHKPWNTITPLSGSLPTDYIYDVHLGSTVAPFRTLQPAKAVLPILRDQVLTEEEIDSGNEQFRSWWNQVSAIWDSNKTQQSKLTLLENFNVQNKLGRQLNPPKHRVVYSTSGTTLAAAIVNNPNQIIEQKLLWIPTTGLAEARYLTAVLNSPITTDRVAVYQSVGLMGRRDFSKYVWMLPIPKFDPTVSEHMGLVSLAEKSEQIANQLDLNGIKFQKARQLIRNELARAGITDQLNDAVRQLLGED